MNLPKAGRHEMALIERRIAELEGKGHRLRRAEAARAAEAAELDRLLDEQGTASTDRHDEAVALTVRLLKRGVR